MIVKTMWLISGVLVVSMGNDKTDSKNPCEISKKQNIDLDNHTVKK